MSKPAAPECEYCGSHNITPVGDCKDCGNSNRKPVTTAETHAHDGWYKLDAQLQADEAKPHKPPTELAENMKVPQHGDWYKLAGTEAPHNVHVEAQENKQVSSMVRYVVGALIVVLLGAAGYLIMAMQQPVPVGLGAH